MRVPVSSLLTLLVASAMSAPAVAQDLPPPLEEAPDVALSEERSVELSEDLYDEEEELDDEGEYDDDAPEPPPTIDHFKRELSPHGQWIHTAEYGLIWVPSRVPAWWRPYSHGQWVYTRYGWTFYSYDPWGAYPFHYGRWVYRSRYGWCWVPGYEWAPAWVSWRYGGGYVAWAPLGPVGVSVSYYSSPSLWIAVQGPHFHRPLVRRHFVPTTRIGTVVFRSTREHRTVRHGPSTKYVTSVTRQPVRRVSVAKVRQPRTVRSTVHQRPAAVERRVEVRQERRDDRRDDRREVRQVERKERQRERDRDVEVVRPRGKPDRGRPHRDRPGRHRH